MTPFIRPMAPEDRPALVRILKSSPEFKPHEVVVAEEVIDAYLQEPESSGYNVLIAEVASGVAGYICFGPTPCTIGTWDIYWIAVAPDERGHGIGRALETAAEDSIRRQDGRLIVIETSSTPLYLNTHRFYFRCGFKKVGQVPDFYAPGDDMIIMVKQLKSGGGESNPGE